MQKNENPIILSAVLLVISALVALLLSFTNNITKGKIAENTIKEQNIAKQEVLNTATEFKEVELKNKTGIVRAVFEGIDKDKKVVGYCVSVTPNGYGGEIDLMVGINPDNTISGIKVVSHSETAGLGAKAADESFSSQFKGKNAKDGLLVIKNGEPKDNEIIAISGATITSRAVKDGVNAAIDAINTIKGGA